MYLNIGMLSVESSLFNAESGEVGLHLAWTLSCLYQEEIGLYLALSRSVFWVGWLGPPGEV